MKIEILGTGCAKCESLESQAKSAATKLGIDFELSKVTNLVEIANRGVMVTPALSIDGTVKISGRVPNEDEIVEMLKEG